MLDKLKGKKTHIIAILMAIVSVVKLLAGDITFEVFLSGEDIRLLLEALGLSSLRAGVAKAIMAKSAAA